MVTVNADRQPQKVTLRAGDGRPVATVALGGGPVAPPAAQSDPQMTEQTAVLQGIGETIGAVLGNTLAMQAAVARSIHGE